MKKPVRFKRLTGIFAIIGVVVTILIVLSILVSVVTSDSALSLGDKVGIIKVEGVILSSEDINRQIKDFSKRDDIKAVVIRINSPGGGVAPSQEIYNAVKRLAEKKKVVASMGSVAASGGYYIAVATEKIVANPGTITGSIGVIVEYINFEELFNKIGLKGNVIKSGKFKDTGSPIREMRGDEKELLQALIDDIWGQFVEAVSAGRGLRVEDVKKLADGRIFSGAQARKEGLVDVVGGLEDAIALAAKLAGLDDDPPLVYPKKRPGGLLRYLLEDGPGSALSSIYSGVNVMYLSRPFN